MFLPLLVSLAGLLWLGEALGLGSSNTPARLNNADAQERARCINIAAALALPSCRLETGNRQLCAYRVSEFTDQPNSHS